LIPDIYTREKLVLERRHQLLHEAKQERMLADLPKHSSRSLQRFAKRLGMYLIALGTRLQRVGQGKGETVESLPRSS
jgi:CRP-like cAMP-binding protein